MSSVKIVGAAITGPATALTLAANGHDVTVYEQRPAAALFSAGILGITHGNWNALTRAGVPMASVELPNKFRDYSSPDVYTDSPFRYIAWTDLHNVLTQTAQAYGARFMFGHRVDADRLQADYVMDAGGIFSASKRLASRYSGFAIYRGTSQVDTFDDFVVYHGWPAGYFTMGHTTYGAAWAMFLPRPEPMHHRTVGLTMPPPETDTLPAEFARVVKATPDMIVSYMSDWDVPHTFADATYRRFTLGDANGPVRPVTTSGANLAVMSGMDSEILVSGSRRAIRALERTDLDRRRYDIALGQMLEGPEIGGSAQDALYVMHHNALFQAGRR